MLAFFYSHNLSLNPGTVYIFKASISLYLVADCNFYSSKIGLKRSKLNEEEAGKVTFNERKRENYEYLKHIFTSFDRLPIPS